MQRPTREQLRQLYNSGPDATIAFIEELFDIIESLSEKACSHETRIKALEDQLAKNSQNSHKPPSSDGLTKKTRSLRQKGQRKVGGQKGHHGHTLKRVANPDSVELHKVDHCCGCGCSLENIAAQAYESRQVFDVPPVKILVTEHQAEIKTCPNCHMSTKGDFPEGVTQPVQYGSRLKGQAVYLMNQHLIPYERTCEIFGDFYDHPISAGTLFNFNQACFQNLEKPVEYIKNRITASPVVHFDETGLRSAGKGHWLHSAGTEEYTYYAVHQKRGKEAMNDIGILPDFTGTAIHDCWQSYLTYEQCAHGLCNAHLLRELNFLIEQDAQRWAEKMKRLLLTIKKTIASAKADRKTRLDKAQIKDFELKYRDIVAEGFKENPEYPCRKKRKKRTKAQNLLRRLEGHMREQLAFMYDFAVPFDNNLAERDIRMVKVQQKISGCFRTTDGAKVFSRIRSYISTARKQGQNVLNALQAVFDGNPSSFVRTPAETCHRFR